MHERIGDPWWLHAIMMEQAVLHINTPTVPTPYSGVVPRFGRLQKRIQEHVRLCGMAQLTRPVIWLSVHFQEASIASSYKDPPQGRGLWREEGEEDDPPAGH